jgi:hypothetical protein
MKTRTNPRLVVYALMHFDGRRGGKSLCAIFSSKKKAEMYASKLKRKLFQKEDSYIVDAWQVNGACA